jgi:hypothetical protein
MITGNVKEINLNIIAKLNWNDFLNANGEFKTRNEISELLDLEGPVLRAEYVKLKAGYGSAQKKYFKFGHKSVGLIEYLSGTNPKGLSKRIRNISNNTGTTGKKDYKKFSESIDMQDQNTNDLQSGKDLVHKLWNQSWSKSYYLIEIRLFLFKFYSNTLKLNSRAAHFNQDINQACDFCTKAKFLPAPKETMVHFFWDCPVTQRLVSFASQHIFGDANVTKKKFFTGICENNLNLNCTMELNLMIFDTMKYVLWEFKWAKKNPDVLSFMYRVKFFVNMTLRLNNKIKITAINTNLFFLLQR